MGKPNEIALKKLIKGGETNTVERKVAAPRATEMAERLCGMANAQDGVVIIGVKDSTHEIVGVPDHSIGETDVRLRPAVVSSLPMRVSCSLVIILKKRSCKVMLPVSCSVKQLEGNVLLI